jgi:AI-2 transport protein TqsA
VAQLAENSEAYKARVEQMMVRAAEVLPLERLGLTEEHTEQSPAGDGAASGADEEPGAEVAAAQLSAVEAREKALRDLLRVPVNTVGGLLVATTRAIANILSNGLLVLVFAAFLLLGAPPQVSDATGVRGEIWASTRRYISATVLVSALTGVMVGFVLAVLNVELALVFGLLAFLLNFIPNIGSVIATLLPLPVVALSPHATLMRVLLVLALPGAVQFVLGNIVAPKLMGRSVKLHPVTVLLALIFWGVLWGVVGMFLAVPMTSVLRILLEKDEVTAPVARLMSGDMNAVAPVRTGSGSAP